MHDAALRKAFDVVGEKDGTLSLAAYHKFLKDHNFFDKTDVSRPITMPS